MPEGLGDSFTWRSDTTVVSDVGYTFVPTTTLPPSRPAESSTSRPTTPCRLPTYLVLAPISNQAVPSGTPVTFTAAATDPFPGANVTFSLAPGAPVGAAINPTTGVFTWTPTTAQAGQLYSIAVNVTDNSTPALSATQSFVVNVLNQLSVTAVTELAPPTPGPLQVAIDFNEAVQPAMAQNIALYKIAQEGRGSLPIQSAVYTDNGSQPRSSSPWPPGRSSRRASTTSTSTPPTSPPQRRSGAPTADQLWVDVTSTNTLKPITVQPDGSFAVSGNSEFLGYGIPQFVVAGNFAGNGRTDLVVVTNTAVTEFVQGNYVVVYDPILLLKSNGDGTYAPPIPIALGGADYFIQSITSVDWNHDGSPDLVVGVAIGSTAGIN